MRSVSQRNPCCVWWFGSPFEVTRYPEHQVKVELLDTQEIELHGNNSLIKKSS